MKACSRLCGSVYFFFFLFWCCLSTALVKHPSNSRQYSAKPTPCQEQFGASAEIFSCRGAVMKGKSKTPTCLAGLPPSWNKSLVTWPDFTHFTEKLKQRLEKLPAAVQYGVLSVLPQAQELCMSYCICCIAEAVFLSTRMDWCYLYWWISRSAWTAFCHALVILEVQDHQVTFVPHHHISDRPYCTQHCISNAHMFYNHFTILGTSHVKKRF